MKITIVGAGTAGWVTASAIKRYHPEIDVVILHDPSIKTMGGVGETLVWNMPKFFHDVLGLKDSREWMKKSQATWKTGVKFHNFGKLNQEQVSSYAPDLSAEFLYTDWGYDKINDYMWNPAYATDKGTLLEIWLKLYNEGKYPEVIGDSFVPCLGETHWFAEYETSLMSKDGEWLTNPLLGHSYHYNAEFVGSTIGEVVGKPAGVIEKIGNVEHVVVEGDSIKCLKLASGEEVYSDLFIDCTGFKRHLVKNLPFVWMDSDEFTNNSSLVRPMFYDGSKRRGRYLHGRSHFYAQSSGWSFEVPLLHRTGNGYSFCSNITPDVDKIADEFNQFLGPRNSDFNEPELRLIKWNPGHYKQFIVGNCMAFGLAWGFIDPYASNNLMATTTMLQKILSENSLQQLQDGTIDLNQFTNHYNQQGINMWDHINSRVQSIFRLSTREDTHYWKTIKQNGIDTNVKQHVYEYFTEKDRMKRWGTKSLLHAYILSAIRCDMKIPSPDINLDEETEKRFIQYCIHKRDTLREKAKNSMPMDEFFKYWYSDDYRGK